MPQETGMAHRQLHPGMEVELDHPNIWRTAVWRVWRPVPEAIIESNILHGRFDFEPTDVWSLVSTGAKLFICDLLESDPIQHPTAREALKNEWLVKWANKNRTECIKLRPALSSYAPWNRVGKLGKSGQDLFPPEEPPKLGSFNIK